MPFLTDVIPALSSWHWVVAGLAVLVIGVSKSGFGGGVGILAVPMFVLAMGPKLGLGAMLPLMLAADAFSVYHHWGTWDRQNLKVLGPGTLAGILIGSLLLAWLLGGAGNRLRQRQAIFPVGMSASHEDERVSTSGLTDPVVDDAGPSGRKTAPLGSAERKMKIAIGAICVLYVLGALVRTRLAPRGHWRARWPAGTTVGVAAGIVSTLAHAGGPVIAIFLLGQHLSKQRFIGTTVCYFFVVNLIKLIPFAGLGMIDTTTLGYGLCLLPLVPVGTWTGARLNRIMSENVFRTTIMVLVLLTGLKMMFS